MKILSNYSLFSYFSLARFYSVPMVLWIMLWAGLQSGLISDDLFELSPIQFVNSIRSLFPLIGAATAIVVIIVKISNRKPADFNFFGPLGLSIGYGLTGLISCFVSPDYGIALQWALLYSAVPIVLLALSWGGDAYELITIVLKLNIFLIFLSVAILLIFSLIYLELFPILSNPSSLLTCEKPGSWFVESSGNIRSTGVGRLAALAALFSLTLMFRRNWWPVFLVVFLISLALLLSTGARTSLGCLLIAGPIVIALSLKRKMIFGCVIGLAIIAPFAWLSGAPQDFATSCLLKGYDVSGMSYLKHYAPEGSVFSQLQWPPNEVVAQPETINLDRHPNVVGREIKLDSSQQKTQDLVLKPIMDPQEGLGSFSNPSDEKSSDEINGSNRENHVAVPTTSQVIKEQRSYINDEKSSDEINGSNRENHVAVPTTSQVIKEQRSYINDEKSSDEINEPKSDNNVFAVPTTATIFPEQLADKHKPTNDIRATLGIFPPGFFQLSGRTEIWSLAWTLIIKSPWLGYGFQGDRLVLGAHVHNAVMQALIQTGFIGTIPFIGAIVCGWFLIVRLLKNHNPVNRPMVIQSGAILLFFSVRAITESSGAFFGIDWLVLAPYLAYMQILNSKYYTQPRGD